MAAFHGCFTFFLLFLISLCFVSTSSSRHAPSPSPSPSHIVVTIRNDLPNTTHQERLRLDWEQDKGGYISTYPKPGDHYNLTLKVPPPNLVQFYAFWGRWFSWDKLPVYEAKRDKGHANVYFSVRTDGFYTSWDGSKWRFIQEWFTE